jgi:putative tricarboxylic transport membrane protein
MLAARSFDRADLAVSAVLIAICAVLWWDTTRWPSVPASLAQNAPPTTFPRLLLGSVFLMALILPFERVWKTRSGVDLGIGGEAPVKPVVFITAAILFLAVYLMPMLGIAPVMLASSLLLPWLWGERRWILLVVFAFGLTAAVTILFAYGLRVNLGFGLTGDIFR